MESEKKMLPFLRLHHFIRKRKKNETLFPPTINLSGKNEQKSYKKIHHNHQYFEIGLCPAFPNPKKR